MNVIITSLPSTDDRYHLHHSHTHLLLWVTNCWWTRPASMRKIFFKDTLATQNYLVSIQQGRWFQFCALKEISGALIYSCRWESVIKFKDRVFDFSPMGGLPHLKTHSISGIELQLVIGWSPRMPCMCAVVETSDRRRHLASHCRWTRHCCIQFSNTGHSPQYGNIAVKGLLNRRPHSGNKPAHSYQPSNWIWNPEPIWKSSNHLYAQSMRTFFHQGWVTGRPSSMWVRNRLVHA